MQALITASQQAQHYFFFHIAYHHHCIDKAATAYVTKIPSAELNSVYVHYLDCSLKNILNQCKKIYRDENIPFSIIIPKLISKSINIRETRNILKSFNFNLSNITHVMSIDLKANDYIPSLSSLTQIQKSNPNLLDWSFPLAQAFGATPALTSMYKNCHLNALHKKANFLHFNLFFKDKPVAALTLSIHNKIARIDDVATLPQFQRRGYASNLISYALWTAKSLNVDYVFLEASAMGLSLYRKLGFTPLYKNYIFSYDYTQLSLA